MEFDGDLTLLEILDRGISIGTAVTLSYTQLMLKKRAVFDGLRTKEERLMACQEFDQMYFQFDKLIESYDVDSNYLQSTGLAEVLRKAEQLKSDVQLEEKALGPPF
ncbi:hypothetical protein GOV04_02720 [Candidatus Woesearchaeota archaeon]|nr:hypothetical protein [Candidatus Woesearchaeota archaeon]